MKRQHKYNSIFVDRLQGFLIQNLFLPFLCHGKSLILCFKTGQPCIVTLAAAIV